MLTFDMNDIDLFFVFRGREFNCCVAFQTGHSEKKPWPELNPRIWCFQRGSLRKWPMSVHEFELTRKRFHITRSGWIIRRSEEATVSSILRFWQILSLYTPENERLEHQNHLMKKGSKKLPNLHFLGFQTSIFQGVPFTHVTNRTSSSKLFSRLYLGENPNGGFIVSGGWSWIRSFFFFRIL